MNLTVRRSTTTAVAIALSALTLAVFAVQQYLGPNSAVQRMHQAVRQQDPRAYQDVLIEPIQEPVAGALYQTVLSLLQQGRQIQFQQTRVRGKVAQVEVLYMADGLPNVSLVYVLGMDRGGWRVSAVETARVFQMLRAGSRPR